MKIGKEELIVNGSKVKAIVSIPEKKDRSMLKKLFFAWKTLNDAIKKISTRGINIPEAITENAFCLFFPSRRVIKVFGGKCSYDCVDLKTGKRQQIKASSISPDLTSFGPRSDMDELYFLDFSKGDGSFKVYKLQPNWVKYYKVNDRQSFVQQQAQGKRPRLSVIRGVIEPNKLRPIKICKL